MPNPTINYLWVGPPPDLKHRGTAGHDILGPKMSQKPHVKISTKFWCLKQYKKHYENIFENINIEVCAIEPYLKKKL